MNPNLSKLLSDIQKNVIFVKQIETTFRIEEESQIPFEHELNTVWTVSPI